MFLSVGLSFYPATSLPYLILMYLAFNLVYANVLSNNNSPLIVNVPKIGVSLISNNMMDGHNISTSSPAIGTFLLGHVLTSDHFLIFLSTKHSLVGSGQFLTQPIGVIIIPVDGISPVSYKSYVLVILSNEPSPNFSLEWSTVVVIFLIIV